MSGSAVRTSRSDQLADLVNPCSHPVSIQRASQKEQISRRCCKCSAIIVRRACLHCMQMTLTLIVCHAWGNPTLMLRSARLTALTARGQTETGPPLSSERHDMASTARVMSPACVAARREPFVLPEHVLNTMAEARAPSTRRLYVKTAT